MVLGGSVAAAGRFLPSLSGSRDPVLLGTAVNLAVLLLSYGLFARNRRTAVS
jgi:hypothetical protein